MATRWRRWGRLPSPARMPDGESPKSAAFATSLRHRAQHDLDVKDDGGAAFHQRDAHGLPFDVTRSFKPAFPRWTAVPAAWPSRSWALFSPSH